MKEYYDILINGIPTGIRVRRIIRGKAWTGAELDNGGFGIAMRTAGQSIKRLFPSLSVHLVYGLCRAQFILKPA